MATVETGKVGPFDKVGVPKPVGSYLWTLGDAIQDKWHKVIKEDGRVIITETTTRGGGALNTYYSTIHLSDVPSVGFQVANPVGFPVSNNEDLYTIERYDNRTTEYHFPPMLAVPQYPWEPLTRQYANVHPFGQLGWMNYEPALPQGLIVSDYNKGMVNCENVHLEPFMATEFAVVDSKYQTLDLELIEKARVKIWRCTAGEYDKDWARNFDYVVHTQHGGYLWIHSNEEPKSATSLAPHKVFLRATDKITDTCGAGDTFTAALGCFLMQNAVRENPRPINHLLIVQACEFAHEAALDVIAQPYTAVPENVRLTS